MATLLALVGAATLWWQRPPARQHVGAGEVAVVPGARDMPAPVRPVIAAPPRSPSHVVPVDPVVAARRDAGILKVVAPKPATDQSVLDGAMMSQARDAATAGGIEEAVRAAVLNVGALATGADRPRVLCVRTTCEVTGRAAAGRSMADVESAMRDPAMLRALVARGYMPGPTSVATDADGTVAYVLYFNNEM